MPMNCLAVCTVGASGVLIFGGLRTEGELGKEQESGAGIGR